MAGLKSQFEHDVMELLDRPLTKAEYDVFCATLEAVGDKARHRARAALLKAVDGVQPSAYLHNAAVKYAIDLLAEFVVTAVLSHDPLQAPDPGDQALMSGIIGHFQGAAIMPAGKSGLPAASQDQATLTLNKLQEAVEKLQLPHDAVQEIWANIPSPPYQGQTKMVGGVQKIWTGTAWVDFKKPAFGAPGLFEQEEEPSPKKPVFDELLERASDRAKDLKAKRLRDAVGAKYEELTGKTLSPEEAEELVIKAIEEKGS